MLLKGTFNDCLRPSFYDFLASDSVFGVFKISCCHMNSIFSFEYSVQIVALKRETAQDIITLPHFYSYFLLLDISPSCSQPLGLTRRLNDGGQRWATFPSPHCLNSLSRGGHMTLFNREGDVTALCHQHIVIYLLMARLCTDHWSTIDVPPSTTSHRT